MGPAMGIYSQYSSFQFPVCPLLPLPLVTAGAISTNGAAGSAPFISLPSRSFFSVLPPAFPNLRCRSLTFALSLFVPHQSEAVS